MKKAGRIKYENNKNFSFPVNHKYLPGASGSPILNDQGQVVGVVSVGSANLILAKEVSSLKSLIAGDIGQNCKAMNIKTCLRKEIENLKNFSKKISPSRSIPLGYNVFFWCRSKSK